MLLRIGAHVALISFANVVQRLLQILHAILATPPADIFRGVANQIMQVLITYEVPVLVLRFLVMSTADLEIIGPRWRASRP
jgi:hypothetical protein